MVTYRGAPLSFPDALQRLSVAVQTMAPARTAKRRSAASGAREVCVALRSDVCGRGARGRPSAPYHRAMPGGPALRKLRHSEFMQTEAFEASLDRVICPIAAQNSTIMVREGGTAD